LPPDEQPIKESRTVLRGFAPTGVLAEMEYWSDGSTCPPSLCSGQVHKVKERNKKSFFALLPILPTTPVPQRKIYEID
jgi:hypothetical protein